MIQKLKELNISFISVYPHTEKVKLLNGSIRRLCDLEPIVEPIEVTLIREEKVAVVANEVIPYEIMNGIKVDVIKVDESKVETKIIKKTNKKHK